MEPLESIKELFVRNPKKRASALTVEEYSTLVTRP